MKIPANYHTHSTLCDGSSTMQEMAEVAYKKGFSYLGFSGHMDADVHMDMEEYKRQIRELQDKYRGKMDILCGVELDLLYDPSCAVGLDYIIGSTHFLDVEFERPLSIDDKPEDVVLLCNEFFDGNYYKLSKAYFELESQVYDRTHCTFVGHFDLVTRFNSELHVFDEESKKFLYPAFEAMSNLVGKGIPFEINTRQSHNGKLFPSLIMLKQLHEMGGEVVISSDAHNKNELDKGFDLAVLVARNAGFDHVNILKKHGFVQFCQIGII